MREREPLLREREALARFPVLRDDLAAPAVEGRAAFAAEARERLADDFAAVERDFAPLDFERDAVFRAAGLRLPRDLPALPLGALAPVLVLALPSIDHLPDITRCAASATASAMIEPSLVALDMTLLAAWDAVSAASSPASRILRRAAGLALIAAAAAAKPAASISLLIAAFANFSAVVLPDFADLPDDEVEADLEDVLLEDVFGDFAIAFLSLRRVRKTL